MSDDVKPARRPPVHVDWRWLLAVPVSSLVGLGGFVWNAAELKASFENEVRVITMRLDSLERDIRENVGSLRGDLRVTETKLQVLERKVYLLEARADGKLPKAFTQGEEDQ